MPNPSKRHPWTVELLVPSLSRWFPVDAFAYEDSAKAHLEVMRKREPQQSFRVVTWEKDKVT